MADFTTTLAEFSQRHSAPASGGRVRSSDEALGYLKQLGYCLLTPRRNVLLPSLSDVADGPFLRWKDDILKHREIFYGRPFRRRSGFVRFNLLPAIYALSPTAAFGGDRFELYKRRFISAEANRIAGIVFAKGPLPTRALRRESGMAGGQHRDRFLRRLAEAESRFLIAKSGITTIEASHYSYLWEPFAGLYAKSVEQSQRMTVDAAATRLITSYLETVGAASIRAISATFTLNEAYTRYMSDQLVGQGKIAQFIEGRKEYLLSTEFQSLL